MARKCVGDSNRARYVMHLMFHIYYKCSVVRALVYVKHYMCNIVYCRIPTSAHRSRADGSADCTVYPSNLLGSWRLCHVCAGVTGLCGCLHLAALHCYWAAFVGLIEVRLVIYCSTLLQPSAIGVATAVMEAPFLAKLHAYAEKLTNVTSGLQFWHKGIIYFVYVLTLLAYLSGPCGPLLHVFVTC